ncbi:heterodisulfide reductase-related iron-sulfur binding cluster, partial [Bacillus cereus]
LITGIELDVLTEKGMLSQPLQDIVKRDEGLYGIDEVIALSIVIPKTQSCCGALHGHAGEKSGAKELAKRNIKAFEDLNIDYI